MKRLTLVVLATAVLVALVAASPSVQSQPAHIAFVDSQAAINAHPAGQKADKLKQEAQTEINSLRTKLDALAQKQQQGQQLTPTETEQYQTLLTTINAVQKRYQGDIQKAAQPAVDAVNKAIREVAQRDGFTIVMDSRAAGQSGSGLVVYADQNLNITNQVIAQMKQDGAIPSTTGTAPGAKTGGAGQ